MRDIFYLYYINRRQWAGSMYCFKHLKQVPVKFKLCVSYRCRYHYGLSLKKSSQKHLSVKRLCKKKVLSKRGKLTTGYEFKQLKQRNVSLLVKLVKLYLDHSRLWKSQESLKIVNLMTWITSGSAR